MASGTDVPPQVRLDKEHSMESPPLPPVEDEDGDTFESVNHSRSRKPPLNLSIMRHCNSSALLAEFVST